MVAWRDGIDISAGNRPYLEKLEYIATHDEVSVVRIHAKGAIRAILSKTIKEPDAKTQNKQVR